MGTSKRPDLWNTKNANGQGPGGYAAKGAFDGPGKGAAFSKATRNKPASATPGPGAYLEEGKSGAGAALMGTSKRTDNFAGKGEADLPGPGNYGEQYSSFSKTQRVVIGGKYKEQISATPGPGSYAANESA